MNSNITRMEVRFLSEVSVKWSRYRPGVAQRVGRGKALLFHDRGTRRGWVVSSTLRPHFTPGKDPVPILQEAGWAPGPVWTENLVPTGIRCRTVQPVAQSLYRLSYPAHFLVKEVGLIPLLRLSNTVWWWSVHYPKTSALCLRRLLRRVSALLSAGLVAVDIWRPLVLTEVFLRFSYSV